MHDVTDAVSADGREVIAAFRLGWTIAELRGRVRLGENDPGASRVPSRRGQHDLPLAGERSPREQQIESQRVLTALAKTLDVDPSAQELTGFTDARAASDLLDEMLKPSAPMESQSSRENFGSFIWAWDAWIQDKLAEGRFGSSSAYQLGRGLAEISWALDPGTPETTKNAWSSWRFLLGEHRVDALKRLLDRLASYFHDRTAEAIKGSLNRWHHAVAAGSVQSRPEAPIELRRQVERWRDLVVVGLDPCLFADQQTASSLARKTRVVTQLAGAIRPQLATGLVSVIVLVVAVLIVPVATSAGAAGTVVGALGITASSISARAKSQASALLDQATASYRERVAIEATTILPSGNRRPRDGGHETSN